MERKVKIRTTKYSPDQIAYEIGWTTHGYYLSADGEEDSEELGYEIDEAATAALPANQTPEMKRRAAYIAEADPIRVQAEGYMTEAQVLRDNGEEEKAVAAEGKAQALRLEYMAKKAEIRARFPDPQYFLSSTGTYHADGCSYATGEGMTLAQIAVQNPAAKPCSRCTPPELA